MGLWRDRHARRRRARQEQRRNDATSVNGFSYGYRDVLDADVIMISSSHPYENHTILFTEWMAPGDAKIIQVNPRKSPTAAYAERTGGLHLQLTPGTDSVLNNAITRYILEQGWEDRDFIVVYTVSEDDMKLETFWRRQRYGGSFAAYKAFLLADDVYRLENAAQIEKLVRAAEMLAKPRGAFRPKASFFLEKGNYWSLNFPNTSSHSALALINGTSGRSGRLAIGDDGLLLQTGATSVLAGDVRAAENVALTSLHTLFAREHNRWVDSLERDHPDWSSDELFHAARMRVEAEVQTITYSDFLPILVGEQAIAGYRG